MTVATGGYASRYERALDEITSLTAERDALASHLRAILATPHADDCQECGIGQSDAWQAARNAVCAPRNTCDRLADKIADARLVHAKFAHLGALIIDSEWRGPAPDLRWSMLYEVWHALDALVAEP